MSKKRNFKFSKEVLVARINPGSGETEYMGVFDSADDVAADESLGGEPIPVARYRLVEVGEVTTAVSYKSKRFNKKP